MQREIKFRGRRLDNGEWVFGYLVNMEHNDDKSHYHSMIVLTPVVEFPLNKETFMHEVDPATVGQYTGEKTCDGEEIYEGDICRFNSQMPMSKVPEGFTGRVIFEQGVWWVDSGSAAYHLGDEMQEWERLGNVWEQPELLGGADNGNQV